MLTKTANPVMKLYVVMTFIFTLPFVIGFLLLVLSIVPAFSAHAQTPIETDDNGGVAVSSISTNTPTSIDTTQETPTPTVIPTSCASTATPAPSCGLAWRVVASDSPDSALNELTGITAVSANDVWAVGFVGDTFVSSGTLIQHWNGSDWSVVTTPNSGAENILYDVAAVSPNDVWAVGYFRNPSTNNLRQTLVLHWNGVQWSMRSSPNAGFGGNILTALAAVSADDVWAVGYAASVNGYATLTLHWNGVQWSAVPSPDLAVGSNFLFGAAAVASDDVWAVGYVINNDGTPTRTITLHWDGTQWNLVPGPNVFSHTSYLMGVTAISANDAWAVGNYYVDAPNPQTHMLISHWDGVQWSIVPSPNPCNYNINILRKVAAVSTNDVWAVGFTRVNIDSNTYRTVVLHWDGTQWSKMPSPNPSPDQNLLNAVAIVSSDDVWAVGRYSSSGSTNLTLVEHYSDYCITATVTPSGTPTQMPTYTPTDTATPSPMPVMVGHVLWQGPPSQPHTRQQLPITLTLKLGVLEVNYPSQNTDPSGYFTVSLDGIADGTYQWLVKGPKYLANSGTVALTGHPVSSVEMGLMRAGDANNDNIISISDANILKQTFALCSGDPGYDARTDFDNSNCVSVVDFNLLKGNFGYEGAPPIGPTVP